VHHFDLPESGSNVCKNSLALTICGDWARSHIYLFVFVDNGDAGTGYRLTPATGDLNAKVGSASPFLTERIRAPATQDQQDPDRRFHSPDQSDLI
jgi:hypothetical protein